MQMFLTYSQTNYKCDCYIDGQYIAYFNLPADFPAPVSGEIVLQADDGFVMRTDKAEDYLRQTFEDGTLILTNIPEPEPTPEPEEPIEPPTPPDELTVEEMASAITEGVNEI